MPVPLAKQGIQGLYYIKYDLSMCTYCSGLNGLMLSAIRYAWKGESWDGVEVLTGKQMQPTPGMEKTILLGKCMSKLHKDNPDIIEAIPYLRMLIYVKGCPPDPKNIIKALHQAGIDADPGLFDQVDMLPGLFMARYQDKSEFDEAFPFANSVITLFNNALKNINNESFDPYPSFQHFISTLRILAGGC